MIECKHKMPVVAINYGVVIESCRLHFASVNDTICRRCKNCEGKMSHQVVEMDLPRRNNNELQAIQMVCNQCPFFIEESQCCKRKCPELNPVSIWAQHPSRHCPENKW